MDIKTKPFPMGMIFQTEEGKLVLYDTNGVPLPDSKIDSVVYTGMTEAEYTRVTKELLEAPIYNRKKYPKEITGFLYAVKCGNKIKLGRTKDLKNRFKQYERVTDDFEVIATAPSLDYVLEERELMDFFGGEAGRIEWFDYNETIKSEVIGYFKNALQGEIFV